MTDRIGTAETVVSLAEALCAEQDGFHVSRDDLQCLCGSLRELCSSRGAGGIGAEVSERFYHPLHTLAYPVIISDSSHVTRA